MRLRLRGKPAPDSFLAGAQAFGVHPCSAAVFEDALWGGAGRHSRRIRLLVVGVDQVGE